MDRDHKLTVFLDSLGADADVGVAVEVLEAHNWDLAAAMESVTGPGQGQGLHSESPPPLVPHAGVDAEGYRAPMRTGYRDTLLGPDPEELAFQQAADMASANRRWDGQDGHEVPNADDGTEVQAALRESALEYQQMAELHEQGALADAIEQSYALHVADESRQVTRSMEANKEDQQQIARAIEASFREQSGGDVAFRSDLELATAASLQQNTMSQRRHKTAHSSTGMVDAVRPGGSSMAQASRPAAKPAAGSTAAASMGPIGQPFARQASSRHSRVERPFDDQGSQLVTAQVQRPALERNSTRATGITAPVAPRLGGCQREQSPSTLLPPGSGSRSSASSSRPKDQTPVTGPARIPQRSSAVHDIGGARPVVQSTSPQLHAPVSLSRPRPCSPTVQSTSSSNNPKPPVRAAPRSPPLPESGLPSSSSSSSGRQSAHVSRRESGPPRKEGRWLPQDSAFGTRTASSQAAAEVERQQKGEAERRRIEVERLQREDVERRRIEAEKLQMEEAERRCAEAEKLQKEEAVRRRAEAERLEKEETVRRHAEAEKLQREEAVRRRAEAETLQREEAERGRAEELTAEAEAEAKRHAAREAEELRREKEEAERRRTEAEKQIQVDDKEPNPVVQALVTLRKHYRESDAAGLTLCLQTLRTYINNLARFPHEAKYQKINCDNNAYRTRVGAFDGADMVLKACGFTQEGTTLVVTPEFLKSKGPRLWDALAKVDVVLDQVKAAS